MKTVLSFLTCLLSCITFCYSTEVNLKKISPLPQVDERDQIGYAGPFVGTHHQVLIIAGGANFPDGLPWKKVNGQSPKKIYHDQIIYYKKDLQGNWNGHLSQAKLPDLVGYGASVSHPTLGVICIGGEWRKYEGQTQQKGLHKQVYALKVQDDQITIDQNFPELPRGLTNSAFGLIDNTIFIACGQTDLGPTNKMWTLDLEQKGTENFKWQEAPALPAKARVLPASTVQFDGRNNAFFIFGGRLKTEHQFEFLTDNWKFTPKTKQWTQVSDCRINETTTSHCAAVSFPSGSSHVIVLGGDHPTSFNRREFELPQLMQQNPEEFATYKSEQKNLFAKHPGFHKKIYSYNAITDTWTLLDSFPEKTPVTTTAISIDGTTFIPSGEIRPGVRSPEVWTFTTQNKNSLQWLAYTVLSLYLLGILINGMIFSKKMKTTDDFFKAGGRIPWWAAGLSIFGTQLSAITFMAVPAMAYASNWQKSINNATILLVAPLVILIFLPFYRSLNITTAYEYLEKRFNLVIRLIGATFFIIMQFSRIGIVLLLPSIALSIATGFNQDLCIIAMGVLCILYTYLGGMEAVIWTDVTQVIILTLGALIALILLSSGSDATSFQHALEQNKLSTFNFNFSLSTENFWVILLGGTALNLISYGSDQSVIQRYLTTSSESESKKSIWTNAILSLPATILFFAIGTALYTYYKTNPDLLSVGISSNDAIFPFYIVHSMPAPLAGLMIAAIFAAAMSSLDSSMNSVSACVTTDFYRRLNTKPSEQACLKLAKMVTVIVGSTGVLFALWMAHSDIKSLWDQLIKYLGLFGGGLGGLFLLGILNKRANAYGALMGLFTAAIAQYLAMNTSSIHSWLYAFVGLISCLIGGSLFSMLFKAKETQTNLTFSFKSPQK